MAAKSIPPLFRAALKAAGLPIPVAEHRFAPPRRWRFDWCWEEARVALEVQGGLWIPGGGRHQRGAALLKEHEKLSEAAAIGWRILYCTPQNLCSVANINRIKRALAGP